MIQCLETGLWIKECRACGVVFKAGKNIAFCDSCRTDHAHVRKTFSHYSECKYCKKQYWKDHHSRKFCSKKCGSNQWQMDHQLKLSKKETKNGHQRSANK